MFSNVYKFLICLKPFDNTKKSLFAYALTHLMHHMHSLVTKDFSRAHCLLVLLPQSEKWLVLARFTNQIEFIRQDRTREEIPWPRCPPGSADWFAPCRKASSSPEWGCEEKTPWGRHSSSSADHTPFFFPGQFGCLTKVFMLRKPGAKDQGAAPISARGLTPFHFFSLRAGGEVQ